jgi:hypothetical protein
VSPPHLSHHLPSTPAEPAQATLLGSATIQEDIKQAHGRGLRGISRGTSSEYSELRARTDRHSRMYRLLSLEQWSQLYKSSPRPLKSASRPRPMLTLALPTCTCTSSSKPSATSKHSMMQACLHGLIVGHYHLPNYVGPGIISRPNFNRRRDLGIRRFPKTVVNQAVTTGTPVVLLYR